MDGELDRFAREMEEGLAWLLGEVRRLRAENARLQEENRELRQEATLTRLVENRQSATEIRADSQREDHQRREIPSEAMAFFRRLPDRLSFTEYFQHAESERIEAEKARKYMLFFVREDMLQQRGRQIEKCDGVFEAPNLSREADGLA